MNLYKPKTYLTNENFGYPSPVVLRHVFQREHGFQGEVVVVVQEGGLEDVTVLAALFFNL